ncbi:serine hydrolase [Erythrobacter sp.]|uniref:serine hydrolase domain-containing protein n=1 Tax=Erythrobacter sp. TaxID=1042 RepID=UPI001425DC48|nr:serine hydrolase [Erythrobacter sp.]QIQ87196.1 MAG: serine hydrolase [Erythrobacter sp.]
MRPSLALLSLAIIAAPLAAQDDPLFERRWESLLAGGYEPLTIPVDWYDPVAEVEGAPTPVVATTPAVAGIAPTALEAAASWAEAQNSTALLVARDGKLVFERYWQGTGRDTRFNPQSMSKTVLALLMGIAIERGEVGSVGDPVSDYVSEWKGEPRGAITLRQMLHMASGLEQGDAGYGYKVTPDNPVVRHSLGSDYTKLPLSLEPVGAPGESFDYNNNVNQLLGIVLERASGRDYEALLSERLWQPLGLADAAMPLDREGGMVITSCCILSRPVDWLRIGQLFVDGGRYEGAQVVPEDWIEAMLEPSPAYRGYGYQVWVGNQQVGGERPPRVPLVPWQSEAFAPPRVVLLHGHGGQRVYAMPDKGLVIVRAARDWPQGWDDALLPNVIWRGTAEEKPE